jgi:hydroxymethylpyrimidine/phosphomethylpyrimidine kinase
VLRLTAPRRVTRNTHGTGCTLSSAIAAGLARGLDLADAVCAAHAYLQGAIAAADGLAAGSGHGPVHHFHELWSR